MDKNYFEVVCEAVCSNGKMKKFSTELKEKNRIEFGNDNNIYEIVYDSDKKQIVLGIREGEINKVLSSWLFDNESMTQKDALIIADDFVGTMTEKEKSQTKKPRKKSDSGDESNVTGIFFANRMVNIFSELREEIREEKERYIEFRAATFARNNILPKIKDLLLQNNEKARLNKFGKLLSELYQNGNPDVRSIITMGILNGIEDEKSINILKGVLNEELKIAWESALKYKGKKVKPSNFKNKKSFLSRMLDAQQMK